MQRLMALFVVGIAMLMATGLRAEESQVPPPTNFGLMLMVIVARNVHQPTQQVILERFTVGAVICLGPADEAGILVGDEVISINGTDLIGITVDEYNLLAKSPSAHMTLMRDDQKIVVHLTSRELKEPMDGTCGLPNAGEPA